jgi:hypothetical protein
LFWLKKEKIIFSLLPLVSAVYSFIPIVLIVIIINNQNNQCFLKELYIDKMATIRPMFPMNAEVIQWCQNPKILEEQVIYNL